MTLEQITDEQLSIKLNEIIATLPDDQDKLTWVEEQIDEARMLAAKIELSIKGLLTLKAELKTQSKQRKK